MEEGGETAAQQQIEVEGRDEAVKKQKDERVYTSLELTPHLRSEQIRTYAVW